MPVAALIAPNTESTDPSPLNSPRALSPLGVRTVTTAWGSRSLPASSS